MGTAVRDLIRAGDRVVGVQTDGPDGPREFAADLVIGTDGRYSTVRNRGAFTEPRSPQHFDVLNFLVPFPDFWPDRTTVRLELGPGCLTGGIPTADGRLWVGMTIQKGQYKALRAAGPDGLTEELLRRTSPDLAAHLRANAEALKHPVLLDVIVGRLERWTAPGLLLLGDAAHPMSPNGGQGINVALRDALVAANHLCQRSLPGKVGRTLRRYGVSPEHLQIEVTESILLGDPELSMRIARELSGMGGEAERAIEAQPAECFQRFGCLVAFPVGQVDVTVDQAGKHRLSAQIDDLCARRNLDLCCRPDLGDAFALQQDHLIGQRLAGLAVEQMSGTDRDRFAGCCALVCGAVDRARTGLQTRAPPIRKRTGRVLRARVCCEGERRQCAKSCCHQRRFAPHRVVLPFNERVIGPDLVRAAPPGNKYTSPFPGSESTIP
jgi:hypothetical protein